MGGQRTGIRNPGDGPGQPPKLTPERLKKVLRARECAMSIEESCKAAGFTSPTHDAYMRRGEEDTAAGKDSIYAEYFREVPLAAAAGTLTRRQVAMGVLKNPRSKADAVARAKLALAYEAMVEGGKESQARRRALKLRGGDGGAPALPAQTEEPKAVPVELSRLDAQEFPRYQQLTAKARAGFTALTPAEALELHALLRKAQGLELTPPAAGADTGGAVPDGSTTPPESSRAPSGDAPPVAP